MTGLLSKEQATESILATFNGIAADVHFPVRLSRTNLFSENRPGGESTVHSPDPDRRTFEENLLLTAGKVHLPRKNHTLPVLSTTIPYRLSTFSFRRYNLQTCTSKPIYLPFAPRAHTRRTQDLSIHSYRYIPPFSGCLKSDLIRHQR